MDAIILFLALVGGFTITVLAIYAAYFFLEYVILVAEEKRRIKRDRGT